MLVKTVDCCVCGFDCKIIRYAWDLGVDAGVSRSLLFPLCNGTHSLSTSCPAQQPALVIFISFISLTHSLSSLTQHFIPVLLLLCPKVVSGRRRVKGSPCQMMCYIDISTLTSVPLCLDMNWFCVGALVSDLSLVSQERPESDTISNNGSVPKNLWKVKCFIHVWIKT